jgi:hypothetical protein
MNKTKTIIFLFAAFLLAVCSINVSSKPEKELGETEELASVPTSFPSSINSNCYLQFFGDFSLRDVSSSPLSTGGQQALLETITDITDIPTTQLSFIDTLSSTSAESSYNLVVQVKFIVPLSDYSQFHGSANLLAAFIQLKITASMSGDETGLFLTTLHQNAILWGNELFSSTISSVSYEASDVICSLSSPSGQPTGQPTSQPTASPTETSEDDEFLEFNAFFGIGNTCTTSLSSEGQQALLQTISDILEVSIESHLQYVGITDSLRRKLLLSTVDVGIVSKEKEEIRNDGYDDQDNQEKHAMVVATKITLPLHEFPEFEEDSQKLYQYMTSLLTEAVNDKIFEKLLRKEAKKNNVYESEICSVVVFTVKYHDVKLHRRNNLPSSAPSNSPTEAPVKVAHASPTSSPAEAIEIEAPSSAPTEATFSAPTSAPSQAVELKAPTSGPTKARKTEAPTSTPSKAKAIEAPTSTPSHADHIIESPTSSPTDIEAIPAKLVQYKAIFWIHRLSSTSFSIDEQTSLIDTIASAAQTNHDNVEYLGIRTVLSRRRRRLGEQQHITTKEEETNEAHELVIATRISLLTSDYPTFLGNTTKVVKTTSFLIRESVENSVFTEVFQTNALINNAEEATTATVVHVEFEDFEIHTPTITSDSKAARVTISKNELAAVVSGIIVGVALLIFCIYVGNRQYAEAKERSDLSKGSASVASGSSSLDSDELSISSVGNCSDSVMYSQHNLRATTRDSIDYSDINPYLLREGGSWYGGEGESIMNDPDMIIINIFDDENASQASIERGFGRLPMTTATVTISTSESRL